MYLGMAVCRAGNGRNTCVSLYTFGPAYFSVGFLLRLRIAPCGVAEMATHGLYLHCPCIYQFQSKKYFFANSYTNSKDN